MRDTHRMKEKLELSLDSRQIVGLLVAGVVVLSTVFVLGVVVGKNLAGDERTAAAPDLLTALDERAVAMEQAHEQADAAFTFQDELTRKAPPAPVAPTAPPSAGPAAATPAPRPEPEPAAAMTEAASAAQATTPAPASAVPTRTSPAGTLKDAIARAQRPAGVVADGAFTLQLSATQNRDEADRFAAKLRDRGYAPYILEADVPGRGKWYRVRMGSFPSKEAASRYLLDFRRETQLEAFVASVN